MRIGITQTSIYVAPVQRGRRSRANRAIRRPNLKPLLLDEAMIPALNSNTSKVVSGFERALGEVGKKWEMA